MKISEAKAMGLCDNCNSGKDGKCQDQEMQSLNYRNVPPGVCALTDEEIKIIKRECGKIKRRRRK